MARALALVSGGLDSILAAKLIKEQGIEVIGICFKSYFFEEENAKRMVKQIDIPLEVVDFANEHLEMVKNPKHGYGKNMNPCIDCHAMMMRYAGELLEKFDADFIISGEVLNQRPMSQNKSSLKTVKKESGYEDIILRPLCAKVLEPTQMEINGMVDRERLLGFSGRTRKPQMELAEKWNIKDYPSPAGGCKITEPNYSVRLRDLLNNKENPEERELYLLKVGRHFRCSKTSKIISTRTADEANTIKKFLTEEDTAFLVKEHRGSLVVIVGEKGEEDIELAAKIAVRYSKGKDLDGVEVMYGDYSKPFEKEIIVDRISDEELNKFMIKE
ncbi:tRNA 4-thiouridine(8) synthase ThiI [Clostridium sp. DL1XJH146]